jgi:hypothetical protein
MHDRLMTYAELAEFLGKSEEAARQFAKRRRWRRSISNDDGKARVSVPVEFLEMPRPPVEPPSEEGPDAEQTPDDQADTLTVVAMLRSQVAKLEAELEGARTALDIERIRAAQVDVLQAMLVAERARVEDIKASEARRIEDLKAERDRWMAQADKLIPLATPTPTRAAWWPWRRTA